MKIHLKFDIGTICYLITDTDNLPRVVTDILISGNVIKYGLSQATKITYHYECEISEEKPLNIFYN
jgi:hypothetical protein